MATKHISYTAKYFSSYNRKFTDIGIHFESHAQAETFFLVQNVAYTKWIMRNYRFNNFKQ